MREFRHRFIETYLEEVRNLLHSMKEDLGTGLDALADILSRARDNRNTIFIMGNGGSAATASHFAGDLSKGTIVGDLPRFKVIALTDSIPGMLAWANDSSYEDIFVEQLKNLMEPGDVVIGISGSGNSMNVIRAIEYANEHEGVTAGFSGYDGGKLARCARVSIHVPSFSMVQVEDVHLVIEHLLTSMLKAEQERSNPST